MQLSRFVLAMVLVCAVGCLAPSASPALAERLSSRTLVSVLGLGDSVPAGSGCSCRNYISLTADGLAARAHRTTVVADHAVGGYATDDVLTQLKAGSIRSAIRSADVVVLTIGANDFSLTPLTRSVCLANEARCYGGTLRTVVDRVAGMIRTIRSLQPAGGVVVVTGYDNIWWGGAAGRRHGSAYVTGSAALTSALNVRLQSTALANGARYASLYQALTGGGRFDSTPYLTADGMHPNAAGHRRIAAEVLSHL